MGRPAPPPVAGFHNRGVYIHACGGASPMGSCQICRGKSVPWSYYSLQMLWCTVPSLLAATTPHCSGCAADGARVLNERGSLHVFGRMSGRGLRSWIRNESFRVFKYGHALHASILPKSQPRVAGVQGARCCVVSLDWRRTSTSPQARLGDGPNDAWKLVAPRVALHMQGTASCRHFDSFGRSGEA